MYTEIKIINKLECVGILHALEEEPIPEPFNLKQSYILDKITHISGSSAGALIGGMYAAGESLIPYSIVLNYCIYFYFLGLRPAQMIEILLKLNRNSFWDLGGIGGLLKGKLFLELIEKALPEEIKTIEDCPIPFG